MILRCKAILSRVKSGLNEMNFGMNHAPCARLISEASHVGLCRVHCVQCEAMSGALC